MEYHEDEVFKFEVEGDTVYGEILNLEWKKSNINDEDVLFVTMEDETRGRICFFCASQLRSRLLNARIKPQKGKRLIVKYFGKVPTKSGRQMKTFEVQVFDAVKDAFDKAKPGPVEEFLSELDNDKGPVIAPIS